MTQNPPARPGPKQEFADPGASSDPMGTSAHDERPAPSTAGHTSLGTDATVLPTPTPGAGALPRYLVVLLTFAAAAVALVGLHLGKEIFGPLAVGAVIVIICWPIHAPLVRKGLPRWLATSAVIALSYAVLIAMALMLAYATTHFIELISEYFAALNEVVQDGMNVLSAIGLDSQAKELFGSLLKPSTLVGFARTLGSTSMSVAMGLFFILAYVIFMAADASRYSRAGELYGPSSDHSLKRFAAFSHSVRSYFIVNAAVGLVTAVIDGVALYLLDVPAALVWAILSFVTNFIPNIGFIMGMVPPALMALVVGDVPLMVAVILIYVIANTALSVLLQPKIVSDVVSLSLTLSFFSVLFWTLILGPLGAILCIPLTLLVRAVVLEGDPGNRWVLWLSGDLHATESNAPPSERPVRS